MLMLLLHDAEIMVQVIVSIEWSPLPQANFKNLPSVVLKEIEKENESLEN